MQLSTTAQQYFSRYVDLLPAHPEHVHSYTLSTLSLFAVDSVNMLAACAQIVLLAGAAEFKALLFSGQMPSPGSSEPMPDETVG
jgi:hypothetical protein